MDEYIEIEVRVIATSDKGVLVDITDIDEEVWIPRSQMEECSAEVADDGYEGKIYITGWIAEKMGII